MENKKRSSGKFVVIGIVAVIVILIGSGISISNNLITTKANMEEQWANVESKLQRRYDLIPNLVASVEGSMKQEQKVFKNIADARSNYANANNVNDKVEASNELNSSLSTLVSVIQESYPELKSAENVSTLMDELSGTENRISVERDRYNNTVKSYNTKIKRFPASIIANMQGYESAEYFKADKGAEKAPTVDFGGTTDDE